MRHIRNALLLVLLLTFTGCEVLEGIFALGVGVGVLMIVVVIALIWWLIVKLKK